MFGRKQQGFTLTERLVVLFWLTLLVLKVVFIGFIIWAIYKLVVHFTASPAATAMLDTAVTYLS